MIADFTIHAKQYCKESTLSDNIWWHQPWRQGVPRSAILEEGGG
eukprot:SAG25_NODE_15026_length_187_cov_122.306818_1_plen_43_part_01